MKIKNILLIFILFFAFSFLSLEVQAGSIDGYSQEVLEEIKAKIEKEFTYYKIIIVKTNKYDEWGETAPGYIALCSNFNDFNDINDADLIRYGEVSGDGLIYAYPQDFRYYIKSYQYDGYLSNTMLLEENSSTRYNSTLVVKEIYSTPIDIYHETTNELVFQKPPVVKPLEVEIQELIAEETPVMANKTIQAMKIILLCGVGCLALLMVLPLLSKIFYRYQN